MNDPNGLVYAKGVYHVFYQYHPASSVWGPMHWGHATSRDLLHWQEEPIALYPDTLGTIFSGSVVIAPSDTTGLGRPWVAIFTHHSMEGEARGETEIEHQSLALSYDEGKTWAKYDHNPVLPNPGMRNFRDPKVFWYAPTRQWIMALAAGDHIRFYASPNLFAWTYLSSFGLGQGAHDGVWECPDLFALDGRWVLLVSINPGGICGGSGTQYFIGDFDGVAFTSEQKSTLWLDHGPDNYAGVSFHNVEGRRLFLAWMSNWQYAQQVPTHPWRSSMTLPRELSLKEVDGQTYLCCAAAREVAHLAQKFTFTGDWSWQYHALRLGFDAQANEFYLERVGDFHPTFSGRFTAQRIATSTLISLELYIDSTSVELIADGGLNCLTATFFTKET